MSVLSVVYLIKCNDVPEWLWDLMIERMCATQAEKVGRRYRLIGTSLVHPSPPAGSAFSVQ